MRAGIDTFRVPGDSFDVYVFALNSKLLTRLLRLFFTYVYSYLLQDESMQKNTHGMCIYNSKSMALRIFMYVYV